MQDLAPYAGIILVVFLFLLNNRLFITPEQLEKKHREIIADFEQKRKDCECKFASKDSLEDIKDQFRNMSEKIDKIYDILLNKKG
jgi:hypothetical protein